ncbi:BnaC07g12970D [Brassica napus]|uniref:BnaC07g12970D protein n=1 Tax=Brassica napus TaxID=3708 RepID=A0A078GTG0_BRANA|nr:BnaC07g12970D [Brassica napus]
MYITNYRSPIARILKRKKRRNQSEVSLPVDFDRAQRDYWCQVRQSEAFDIGNASIPSNMCGMITGLFPIDCIRERGYPYHVLVNLYAKVGLHRYNMLKVTKKSLLKFNMLQNLILRDEMITKKPLIPHFHGDAVDDGFFKGELPDWPSDDALNDGKRFYSVRLFKSEWQANYWISMYLELVICAHDRMI